MNVDIYVREKNGSREIRFPILPEKIRFKTGEASFITYDIMSKGEVAIPSGVALSGYSWESEFPGSLQQNNSMLRGTWQAPENYHNILNDWKSKRVPLTILVTGYPINSDVYIEDYNGDLTGAFGEISYEVSFLEAKPITITTSTVDTTEAPTTVRPTSAASNRTVRHGDTLWSLSMEIYRVGLEWESVYEANKEIIERTAREHGKSSSENGHWIYPGTVLTIPSVGGSGSGADPLVRKSGGST